MPFYTLQVWNFHNYTQQTKQEKKDNSKSRNDKVYILCSFILQPSDSSEVLYDAKIQLSRQSMTEIEALLEGKESWTTGALDNAISQILVDIRPHNSEVWRWRFEDAFGVELDTLIKVSFRHFCNLFLFLLPKVRCCERSLWWHF